MAEARAALVAVETGRRLLAAGNFQEAAQSLLSAVGQWPGLQEDDELMQDLAVALRHFTATLQANGNHPAALWLYENAIKLAPSWRLQHDQSLVMMAASQPRQALAVLEDVHKYHPNNRLIQATITSIKLAAIDRWHYPMINDNVRNQAYRDAITVAVADFQSKHTRAPNVLDIGTGTGLLSIYAAQAGAKHVWACESNALLADIAQECLATNGCADKVTIVHEYSTNLALGQDLAGVCLPPQGFDIIVTELVDAGLLGERCVPVLHHARTHLASKHCIIIPEHASIWLTLVSGADLRKRRQDLQLGPHANVLRHVPTDTYTCEKLGHRGLQPLSTPVLASESISLQQLQDHVSRTCVELAATSEGTVDFIGLAWRMVLYDRGDDAIFISTLPNTAATANSWDNALFPVTAIDVKDGDRLTLHVNQHPDRFEVMLEASHQREIRNDSIAPSLEQVSMTELELARVNDAEYQAFYISALSSTATDEHVAALLDGCSYWYTCSHHRVSLCVPDSHFRAHQALTATLKKDVLLEKDIANIMVTLTSQPVTSVVIATDLFDASGLINTTQLSQAVALATFCIERHIAFRCVPQCLNLSLQTVEWPDQDRLTSLLPRNDGLDLSSLKRFEVPFAADATLPDARSSTIPIDVVKMLHTLSVEGAWISDTIKHNGPLSNAVGVKCKLAHEDNALYYNNQANRGLMLRFAASANRLQLQIDACRGLQLVSN
eukprot:TRINITY_DN4388_c0_g1_i1.p1 TRINITY_DN4388_c0_g1~~TRINITY_DN4388_c0_g1_i1.p1  ORF type:complete len:723 (+),score=146.20 TRINITY_DN4388_c0_g1_i1:36-2204(+)